MEGHKLVSIIIPCYNQGHLLPETLQSLENIVDYSKHEVIIINDGSTDELTNNYIQQLKTETNLYKIIIQENRGLSGARNRGISEAKGKYILPLDSDNKLTDLYLTAGVEILETDESVDVIYGESRKFGEENGLLPTKPWHINTILQFNYIDACALIRYECVNSVGGYDEQMKQGWEDWDLWIRLTLGGSKFRFLKGQIAQEYRVLSSSMLRTTTASRYEEIMKYLENKYKGQISWRDLDDFFFSKFNQAPILWTTKLFLRKYWKKKYQTLIKKRKIKSYL